MIIQTFQRIDEFSNMSNLHYIMLIFTLYLVDSLKKKFILVVKIIQQQIFKKTNKKHLLFVKVNIKERFFLDCLFGENVGLFLIFDITSVVLIILYVLSRVLLH